MQGSGAGEILLFLAPALPIDKAKPAIDLFLPIVFSITVCHVQKRVKEKNH
jgi:hypothetical protein